LPDTFHLFAVTQSDFAHRAVLRLKAVADNKIAQVYFQLQAERSRASLCKVGNSRVILTLCQPRCY